MIEKFKKSATESYIMLSRTSENFIKALFKETVPELQDGVIEIVRIAREPGEKTKIAVYCEDRKIDPVGACIGPRGSRIQEILTKVNGERIDVVKFDEDVNQFARNIFSSAEPKSALYNPDTGILEMVVDDDKKSLCIGRGGQNVRLASALLNCDLDVLSVTEKQDSMKEKFEDTTKKLVQDLDIDESIAQLLVGTGFFSTKDIAKSDVKILSGIQFFNEEIAQAVYERATEVYDKEYNFITTELVRLGIEKRLIDTEILTPEIFLLLARVGVKSFEDFKEISVDEMQDIIGKRNISKRFCRKIIKYAEQICESIKE